MPMRCQRTIQVVEEEPPDPEEGVVSAQGEAEAIYSDLGEIVPVPQPGEAGPPGLEGGLVSVAAGAGETCSGSGELASVAPAEAGEGG